MYSYVLTAFLLSQATLPLGSADPQASAVSPRPTDPQVRKAAPSIENLPTTKNDETYTKGPPVRAAEPLKKQMDQKARKANDRHPNARDTAGSQKDTGGKIVTPVQVDLKAQIVSDPGVPTARKILLSATLDPSEFDDTEEGYTSIEQVSPDTGQLFSQENKIHYAVRAGTFACELPILNNPARDTPYSFVLSITSQKSNRTYNLKAQDSVPALQSVWDKLGLAGILLFGSIGLVLATALVFLVIWFIKARNRPPEVVYVQQLPSVRQEPIQPVADPYIVRTVKDVSQRVATLEQNLNSLLNRPTDEWRKALGNVSDLQAISAVLQPRTARQGGRSGLLREEQVILAVVNHWISSGGTNRQQMLTMGAELGQDTKLMQHVNVARILSDVTALGTAEFAESTTDGGWLCSVCQDGVTVAAPADARLFQLSQERALLQRTFDGVDAGSGPVQFAQVYRPCRLRLKQAPNRYEILHKGLLHLIGQATPAASAPPDYLSVRQQMQNAGAKATSSPTLVSVVGEQLEALSSRLASIENITNGLNARSEAPISTSRIADLDQVVLEIIQRQIQQLEQRLTQQMERLRQPAAASPVAAAPGGTALKLLGQETTSVRTLVQELAARIDNFETSLAARIAPPSETKVCDARRDAGPIPNAIPGQEEVNTVAANVPSSPRAQSPALMPKGAGPSSEIKEQLESKSRGLPIGWQDAVSALDPFKGVVERDVAENLMKLLGVLQRLPGGADIRLVHLMEAVGKFRVHNAVLSSEGQVFCGSCDGARTFQAAVCAGEDGAPELYVLFAAGDCAPYNYPAGYRQLIQNVPNQQFQIQRVLTPAVLTRISGNSATEYAVQEKMQWR